MHGKQHCRRRAIIEAEIAASIAGDKAVYIVNIMLYRSSTVRAIRRHHRYVPSIHFYQAMLTTSCHDDTAARRSGHAVGNST